MEKKELYNVEDRKQKIDYKKLNKPINFVCNFFHLITKYNDTILHYAVYEEKEEIVKYLVKHQANVDILNKVYRKYNKKGFKISIRHC